ncbi:carbohydrate ABC transporter permease [Paenibacillus sp. y28]|uniref:carbohydrate ABC transporter permease n=1 Tax=Paenibacillus sp. y28 TaxID=3129110 RepID=UPI00301B5C77
MPKSFHLPRLLLTLLMLVLGVLFLLPFIWMLSASFKPESDVFKYPIEWIPTQWNLIENYKEVWLGDRPFWIYYVNSIKVTVLTTIISSLVSALAAYGFAKIQFKASKGLFFVVLATYMVPSQAILVPQFILYRMIGLFDSHFGLILLCSFSVLGTFMLRQFFMGLHNEYIESAKIDGASHLRIFLSIAFPLVRPAVATYAILRFIWTWNDYQNPLIFLRSDKLFTIPLAVTKFTSMSGEYYSLIMAAAVSAIVPLLIMFVIGQKHVIEGISVGGVKG